VLTIALLLHAALIGAIVFVVVVALSFCWMLAMAFFVNPNDSKYDKYVQSGHDDKTLVPRSRLVDIPKGVSQVRSSCARTAPSLDNYLKG
jgi:hypothetical protein